MDLREECFSHVQLGYMWLALELVLQKAYIYWRPHEEHQMFMNFRYENAQHDCP
jgi:hypothetical protein